MIFIMCLLQIFLLAAMHKMAFSTHLPPTGTGVYTVHEHLSHSRLHTGMQRGLKLSISIRMAGRSAETGLLQAVHMECHSAGMQSSPQKACH